ncbi:hypothetical protein DF122_16895 [Burkholderia pseudomallei]|uniref:Uncharacterized protein n=1 Tax=Burkholderia mallei TaxID=13373 RepID=A0AAX1ZUA5_BURML|nr:hypothetical protein [Burkholderia pseudomallei]RUN03855.1 hypothetical protein EGT61_031175 [Burkholderia mallei]NRD86694.1 hypothetical protein [Burkholderia pseudomallei]NRE49312.1 hypothetical protein [Burkholderia pseudomallei]QBL83416.1 hypothetical protein EYA88_01865 [Burkholderia pseudomallei]
MQSAHRRMWRRTDKPSNFHTYIPAPGQSTGQIDITRAAQVAIIACGVGATHSEPDGNCHIH